MEEKTLKTYKLITGENYVYDSFTSTEEHTSLWVVLKTFFDDYLRHCFNPNGYFKETEDSFRCSYYIDTSETEYFCELPKWDGWYKYFRMDYVLIKNDKEETFGSYMTLVEYLNFTYGSKFTLRPLNTENTFEILDTEEDKTLEDCKVELRITEYLSVGP